jgi:hypothetical protein
VLDVAAKCDERFVTSLDSEDVEGHYFVNAAAARLATRKDDHAAVINAEAFFSLTDLRGLSRADAVASLMRTAQTITAAAMADMRCAP